MPVHAGDEVLLDVVEHVVEPLGTEVVRAEPGLLALVVLSEPLDAVHVSRLHEEI